jgi:hypothetical protein
LDEVFVKINGVQHYLWRAVDQTGAVIDILVQPKRDRFAAIRFYGAGMMLPARSRAYKKNDQAWIEQKNGAVVRRLVGYGRLEGAASAAALGKRHEFARLYVNFFQPSFKLKSKTRCGAKVSKKYQKPATPYERLLADDRLTSQCKDRLRQIFESLDPVHLLSQIREAQRSSTHLEVGAGTLQAPEARPI